MNSVWSFTWSELAEQAKRALATAEQLGVRWVGTRFDAYIRAMKAISETNLAAIAQRTSSSRIEWEALSQSAQLVNAARLFPLVPADVLTAKLRDILSGPEVLDEDADDKPRNVLFEFTVGELLASHGFKIQMTGDAEDLVASHPDLAERFSVECKRPARCSTSQERSRRVRANLVAIRRQLLKRDRRNIGWGALGMDGVWATSDRVVIGPDAAGLQQNIAGELSRNIGEVKRLAESRALRLEPVMRVGALVFVGVGVDDTRTGYAMQSMRLFFVGNEPQLGKQMGRIFAANQ
jgi:hypothetical protein